MKKLETIKKLAYLTKDIHAYMKSGNEGPVPDNLKKFVDKANEKQLIGLIKKAGKFEDLKKAEMLIRKSMPGLKDKNAIKSLSAYAMMVSVKKNITPEEAVNKIKSSKSANRFVTKGQKVAAAIWLPIDLIMLSLTALSAPFTGPLAAVFIVFWIMMIIFDIKALSEKTEEEDSEPAHAI